MPKNQLRRIIDTKRSTDGLVLMTGTPPSSGGGGGVTDHGLLDPLSLRDDDHSFIYYNKTVSDARYAQKATITLGDGILGTTVATGTAFTIAVGVGNGINVLANSIELDLADNSGLTLVGTAPDQELAMGLPTTITVASLTNSVTTTTHAHAITTNANPTNAQILASNGTGGLGLTRLNTPIVGTAAGALTLTALTDVLLQPANNLSLNPGSYLVNLKPGISLQSENYASQVTGMHITYAGEGDFRYLYTDEMHAKAFIADLEQALAGGQIISKSVAILDIDFTAPAAGATAWLTVKSLPSADNMDVFEAGDFVRIRVFSRAGGSLTITDCWGTVRKVAPEPYYGTNPDTGEQNQRWHFTRRPGTIGGAQPPGAMATGTIVQAGTIILDYGESGNGYYEVNAIDGLRAVNSPYAQIVTWVNEPANQKTVNARFGNLHGIWPTETNEYGLYVGDGITNADSYLRLSNRQARFNKVPIQMWNDGGVQTGLWAANGSFTVGSSGLAAANTDFSIDTLTGRVRIGRTGTDKPNLHWDAVTGIFALRQDQTPVITFDSTGSSYFAGIMNIGTAGEIRQGTVTSGSVNDPWANITGYTGLRVWRQGNLGRIGGYKGGFLQWSADTSGRLTAGNVLYTPAVVGPPAVPAVYGPSVMLHEGGLSLLRAQTTGSGVDISSPNAIQWWGNFSTDTEAAASIVAGLDTQGYGFISMNLPIPNGQKASIGLQDQGGNIGAWYNGISFVSGFPGLFAVTQPTGDVIRLGGAGTWVEIAQGSNTAVYSHWSPANDAISDLGSLAKRWRAGFLAVLNVGQVQTNILPSITVDGEGNGLDLGSSLKRWRNLWINDIQAYAGHIVHLYVSTTGPITRAAGEGPSLYDTEPGPGDLVVEGNVYVGGTTYGGASSGASADIAAAISAHASLVNVHHPKVHQINGVDHYIVGGVAGTYLRVQDSVTFGFSNILLADLPTEVLRHSGALVVGQVLRATTTSAYDFSTVQHSEIGGITANQHHSQLHAYDDQEHHSGKLSWINVNKLGSSITDLSSRGHSLLSNIGPNDHHDQVHDLDSSDHVGDLSWAKVDKTGANIVDIPTRSHASMQNLSADDHAQYVHNTVARTITAVHSFAPPSASVPFTLTANAQGQTVTGFKADQLNKSVIAGNGLTGGGALTASVTLNVGVGALISVLSDSVGIIPATNNYSFIYGDPDVAPVWRELQDLAGNGLAFGFGMFMVNAGNMIDTTDDTVSIRPADSTYQVIVSGATTLPVWSDISNLAGASLTSTAGKLFVNQAYNYSWTGTHDFVNFVSFQNNLNTKSLFPVATDTYDIGSYSMMYRQSFISQINAVVFAENTAQLLGGWFIIPSYAGKLGEAITAAQTVVDFGTYTASILNMNDVILIRAHNADGVPSFEYMTLVSSAGGNSWNVTRNTGGAGAHAWPDGTPYMLIGKTNYGRIELNAYDTPRISIMRQTTDAYNSTEEVIRIGDLNGLWNYATPTWGMTFGRYNSVGNTWFSLDLTNGLRIGNVTDIIGQWDTTGKVIIGRVQNTKARVEIDDINGFRILYKDGTATDKTLIQLAITGNATLTGVLGLGSLGGVYQGSGDFTTPVTGLKIWNNAGVGSLTTYDAGTVQVSINSTGQLTAGGGNAILDKTGISVRASGSFSDSKGYRFVDAADVTTAGFWTTNFYSNFTQVNIISNSTFNNVQSTLPYGEGAELNIRSLRRTSGTSATAFVRIQAGAYTSTQSGSYIYMMDRPTESIIDIVANTSGKITMIGEVVMQTGRLTNNNGTVSEPAYGFINGPTSGMWYTSGALNFAVAGNNRMSISSTGGVISAGLGVSGTITSSVGSAVAGGFSAIASGQATYTPYRFNDTHGTGMAGAADLYIGLMLKDAWHLLSRTDGGSDSWLALGYGITTTNRNARVDFHTNAAAGATYTARIIRTAGPDGNLILANEGAGIISLQIDGVTKFVTNSLGAQLEGNTTRLVINTTGYVSKIAPGGSVSIVNNGTANLGTGFGFFFLINHSSGYHAVFASVGAATYAVMLESHAGQHSHTVNTAGRTNVYKDAGGNMIVQNMTGATRNYSFHWLGGAAAFG